MKYVITYKLFKEERDGRRIDLGNRVTYRYWKNEAAAKGSLRFLKYSHGKKREYMHDVRVQLVLAEGPEQGELF